MKRAHVFGRTLLALVIATSLAACGGGNGNDGGATATVAISTSEAPPLAVSKYWAELERAGIRVLSVQCFERHPSNPDPATTTEEYPPDTTNIPTPVQDVSPFYYIYEISSHDLVKVFDFGYFNPLNLSSFNPSSFNLTPRSCSE